MGIIRTAAAVARQEERTKQRRTQILDAARACVGAEGFHAASMSRIAAEASMSVGHIYQYFENKEAIMIALSERDFEDFMRQFTQLDDCASVDVTTVIETLISKIMWLVDYDRAALALEVMAEASRNAKVAELILRVDRRIRTAIRKIIEPALEGLAQKEVEVCVETLLVMTRALVVHAGTHRVKDPQVLAAGFERAFRGLLTFPEHSGVTPKPGELNA